MLNQYFYAQLDSTGVVVAKSELHGEVQQAELIALESLGGCNLGDRYVEGVFVDQETEKLEITQITVGAFRRRLTLAEKIAVKTSGDPVIQVFNDDLMSLTYVDINDPELFTALQYLAGESLFELAEGQTNEDRVAQLLRTGTQAEAL